jgi:predicted enzyme related to lactoylglutathione lyase
LVAPFDFPGGRMAIVSDPQGAAFGLMALSEG